MTGLPQRHLQTMRRLSFLVLPVLLLVLLALPGHAIMNSRFNAGRGNTVANGTPPAAVSPAPPQVPAPADNLALAETPAPQAQAPAASPVPVQTQTPPPVPTPPATTPATGDNSTSRGGYDRTRPLAGRTIVVDPGHGPVGSGAADNGSDEATNVLSMAFKVKSLLEGAGAEVVMTRTTMVFPGGVPGTEQLSARTALANRVGPDIFVSIHNNWYDDPGTRGSMTFYSRRGDSSAELARSVQDALIASTGAYSHGTEPANYYVVKYTTMPAILVESGFLSNAADAAQDKSDSYQTLVARGIFRGIIAYFANR